MELYFPMEFITALLVYVVGLEKRKNGYLRVAVTAAAIAAVFLLCFTSDVGEEHRNYDVVLGSFFGCGIIFFLMTLAVFFICRVSFRETIYCSTCAYLSEHIAYCIRLIANNLTESKIADAGTICYLFIHALVYVLSWYLVARKLIQNRHYVTSAVRSLGFMMLSVLLVLVMSVLASAYEFEFLHGIYAGFGSIIILYSQVKQQEQLNLQAELNLQQQLWMKHKAQYEMSKDAVDIINQKCHDLKYQIEALRRINSPDEQKKAIDAMEESVSIYDSVVNTENEILNAVLTEKSLLCRKNGINLNCIADGKLLSFMDAVDIYILFGNALDNAMEAVMKLTEEKRFISALLYEKKSLIFFQVENYYEGELKLQDNIPITTKEEKEYHGFGVRSIQQIVEKYHGFVTIETANQIFLLRITIPKPEELV